MSRTPSDIAQLLVAAMESDNCVELEVAESHALRLCAGIRRMQEAGCTFTDAQIDELASGDMTDVEEKFARFAGFTEVDGALNDIFDGAES